MHSFDHDRGIRCISARRDHAAYGMRLGPILAPLGCAGAQPSFILDAHTAMEVRFRMASSGATVNHIL